MEIERKDLIPATAVQFMSDMEGFVTDWLARGQEVPLCAYVGVIGDDEAHVMPIPAFGSNDVFALAVRAAAEALNADFAMVVCEAWKASATKEAREQHGGDVKDMPGASDVIYFQLECKNGVWAGSCNVAPWEKGKPRTMGTIHVKQGSSTDGRFAGLLPVKKLTAH